MQDNLSGARPRSEQSVGAWLSLVEHSVRDRGVGGSNPLAPTKFQKLSRNFLESLNGHLDFGVAVFVSSYLSALRRPPRRGCVVLRRISRKRLSTRSIFDCADSRCLAACVIRRDAS